MICLLQLKLAGNMLSKRKILLNLLLNQEEEMNPKRIMCFIDGENLVCRYQDMLKKGYVPKNNYAYKKDEYLWSENIGFNFGPIHVVRSYYYTSVIGDEAYIETTKSTLSKIKVFYSMNNSSSLFLYPIIFKKNNRSAKAKGVDIPKTVDILTHVYQSNVEAVCIFTGDGDYQPVIKEAIRYGKQVYIGAFSSGLNPIIPHLADEFLSLDQAYFDLSQYSNPETIR